MSDPNQVQPATPTATPGRAGGTTAATVHVPVLHTAASFPAPTAEVAKVLNGSSMEEQRTTANAFFDFLTEQAPSLLRLNEGDQIHVALLNIPKTQLVKVVYCTGMGSSPIGTSTPTDGKLLVLQGDGDQECGPPQPLCLDTEVLDKNTVAAMTETQFSTALTTKGPSYSYPLVARNAVTTSAEIIKLAPVPPYLVYDGFENDLDAALVLERVMSTDTQTSTSLTHLKTFLRACLSSHKTSDNKPYLLGSELSAAPNMMAKRWAKTKFKMCFPTLSNPTPPTAMTTSNTTAANTNIFPQGQTALLDLIAAIKSTNSPTTAAAGKSPDDTEEQKLMSGHELESTLRMCGQASTGGINNLPAWLKDCAAKGTSEQYKLTIIQKHIMTNFFYEDADVPLTSPLLKMIMKRAWCGKDGNVTRPSLLHAMDGLSPFTMLDLNEDEVAMLNSEEDLITSASLVSVADLRLQRKKSKVCVPQDASDFMLMMKRYANMIYAIFSELSPLFKLLREIVRALRDFSRDARKRMTINTKGSILWIILLQSRQFALGEMNVLCEFTTMHDDLRAKRAQIHHSEMPMELLKNSVEENEPLTPTKRNPGVPVVDVDKIPKRQKTVNPNNWNPKLKAALEGPLKEAGNPTFTKIMNFCKRDSYSIIPKSSPICSPNLLFGTCFFGDKCTKKHVMATDAQVAPILALVAEFIKDPKKLNTGQYTGK